MWVFKRSEIMMLYARHTHTHIHIFIYVAGGGGGLTLGVKELSV